jgi:hypothetical protein
MLRAIAKWYARRVYIWQLEFEAGKSDVNAAIAKRNADETRKLAEQLNTDADVLDKEADAIQANIKEVEAEEQKRFQTDEYKKLTKQEQYEDDRASQQEKNAAVQLIGEKRASATEKRGLAAEHAKSVSEKEQTAQSLRGLAANSRMFADKIREL